MPAHGVCNFVSGSHGMRGETGSKESGVMLELVVLGVRLCWSWLSVGLSEL